jgi:hypothetical protein
MSDTFDVKFMNVPLPGTPGTAFVPLLHNPSTNGAITLLEAQLNNGTGGVPGSVALVTGTIPAGVGTGGTFVPVATIGTSYGTGGGTFPANTPVPLAIGTAVIPANQWLAIQCAGTFNCAAQSVVTLAYVNGR